MKRLMLLCALFFAVFSTAYGETAGVFQPPLNPLQVWGACGNTGYWPLNNGVTSPSSQYYMEMNTGLSTPMYHMGEDWNGKCGSDTDIGGDLRAIADGQVASVDSGGLSAKGKYVVIRYTLPDGKQAYSWYLHCDSILVSVGNTVTVGQKIATIGRTGLTVAEYAHLHWEIHKDTLLTINSYQQPLAVSTTVKMTGPSLFVDDRIGGVSISIINGNWIIFTVQNYTPSSTAYIQNQSNERFSIKRAVDAGLIASYGVIWQGTDGGWYYNPDVTQIFFEPGVNYAILAQGNSLSLNLLFPGNNYKGDRARIDMVRAAMANVRFMNVQTETYAEDLSWDPSWELRYMGFEFSTSGSPVYINHATSKTNPFIRYTTYYDPAINQWTPWVEVGKNTLY